ncbi:MAG: MarR family transcriptional regulator [Clostridiales bacterium]|nr:MarR family transcriptional regulator [Clostridiales bacterium]
MDKRPISCMEIWDLLTYAQSLMNILERRMQVRYDITPRELRVLLELDGTEGLSISELSKGISRDFGNVSRTCQGLVKKGLLIRQRADGDLRVTIVVLTSKGKEKLDLFYKYNLIPIQNQILGGDLKRHEDAITGMKEFLAFITERMEEIDV